MHGKCGSSSARYCYAAWLHHLLSAHEHGLSIPPGVVAELGPGNSLGTGLAALLSGAQKYYALDSVELLDKRKTLALFDDMLFLFKNRERIPGKGEFPEIEPYLDVHDFPSGILTENLLARTLDAERTEQIRNAIVHADGRGSGGIGISYSAPWDASARIPEGSVDMIFSQFVMEHVDELLPTYEKLHKLIKPGGFMSHIIDFKSHGYTAKWNGHWVYTDRLWRLARGKRSYFINRHPHSRHIDYMRQCGFEIIGDHVVRSDQGISRRHLAREFQDFSDEDLTTSLALIQAVKK